jgi:glucose-6-phosphate 3-dehydrogenase
MAKLRGAVLGFGNAGQSFTRYINNKRDDAEVVVACNRGKEKLEIAKHEFGIKTTHDPQEAIDMADFVIISSSNFAHKEHVELTAKARKPIFCEKPVAITLEEAEYMARLVEEAGVINVVNYSFRYIPAYILLKEMIDRGDFGRVLMAWTIRLRAFGLYEAGKRHVAVVRPEESAAWTVHHLCHAIDTLYWWFGPMKRVYSLNNTTVPVDEIGKSEEAVWGMIDFENGTVGSVGDSVCIMREHHSGIIGTKATAILQGEGPETTLRVRYEDTEETRHFETVDRKPDGVGLYHFFDCLSRNEHSKATIRDSIPSLRAALAMQHANDTGQTVDLSTYRQVK